MNPGVVQETEGKTVIVATRVEPDPEVAPEISFSTMIACAALRMIEQGRDVDEGRPSHCNAH